MKKQTKFSQTKKWITTNQMFSQNMLSNENFFFSKAYSNKKKNRKMMLYIMCFIVVSQKTNKF
jgi:hypothetical protein